MSEQQQQRRTLELPPDVYARLEDRVPRTEFDSANEYATHVLEEVLAHVERETGENFEAVDEAEVEDRLKSLGYLNE